MNQQEIIQKTANYVKSKLEGEGSGHDWWHILRVWNNAKHVGVAEGANMFIVEIAALLHDLEDWKFQDNDDMPLVNEWLTSNKISDEDKNHIITIIKTLSFKGVANEKTMETLDGKVVRDADRLDAIGAVGIARVFTYGGSKSRPIYNPNNKIEPNMTKEQYMHKSRNANEDGSINHFYEKLLLLKDLMLTKTGKELAEGRHKYMEEYLKQFFDEWEGKA